MTQGVSVSISETSTSMVMMKRMMVLDACPHSPQTTLCFLPFSLPVFDSLSCTVECDCITTNLVTILWFCGLFSFIIFLLVPYCFTVENSHSAIFNNPIQKYVETSHAITFGHESVQTVRNGAEVVLVRSFLLCFRWAN